MEVTVVLSGFPQCNPQHALGDLAYYLDKLFDTNEIGTFKVRDLSHISHKRQVALDFSSGFDAMYAQNLLDGKTYSVNGVIGVLRARVAHDPKHKPELSLSQNVKVYYKPNEHFCSSVDENPQLSIVTNKLLMDKDKKIDAKLKLLNIKKKDILTEEEQLLLERERLRRELQELDSVEDSPPKKRSRSLSSETDNSKAKTFHKRKRRSDRERPVAMFRQECSGSKGFGFSSTSFPQTNVIPRRPPRPESRRNEIYECSPKPSAIEYRPQDSSRYEPNLQYPQILQSNVGKELHWEPVVKEFKMEEVESLMMDFRARKEEMKMKKNQAIKDILLELENEFRDLCERHNTSSDEKSKVLNKVFGIIEKRMKCIKVTYAMTVSDVKMHYRCKYSKIEDKDLVIEMFNELQTTRSKSPVLAPATSSTDGLWSVLDTVLQGFNLASLTEDDIKTEIEDQEEEITNITININPIASKQREAINVKRENTFTSKQDTIGPEEENPVYPNCIEVITIDQEDKNKKKYIVDDGTYYINITVDLNRPKKYYITIKLLMKKMKCYIKKYEYYVVFDLFEYVIRQALERQIAELLEENKVKIKAKELLRYYRQTYPEEDDEDFVLQTLYEIWEGKYNDSADNEDDNRIPSSVDLPKVKKEIDKPESEKTTPYEEISTKTGNVSGQTGTEKEVKQETDESKNVSKETPETEIKKENDIPESEKTTSNEGISTKTGNVLGQTGTEKEVKQETDESKNVSKETPETEIKKENAMKIVQETDETKEISKESDKSRIKQENNKGIKLDDKIDAVKNEMEELSVPVKEEINARNDDDVMLIENSNNCTEKSETVKSEKTSVNDVVLIEPMVEIIDLSDTGEFDFAGDNTTQNVTTEATVDRKSDIKRNKNVKCNADDLKDETKNKMDIEYTEFICLSDDEIIEVIDDDCPETSAEINELKSPGATNHWPLQNQDNSAPKSDIVFTVNSKENASRIDFSDDSNDTLILGEETNDCDNEATENPKVNNHTEENVQVREQGDTKEARMKVTISGKETENMDGNKPCAVVEKYAENANEEIATTCAERNSDFFDENVCETVETIKQYLNSLTRSVEDSKK